MKQIAEFCNLHELEIKGIADGDVAKGIKAYTSDSKIYNGQEYIVFAEETEYVYRLESGSTFDGTAISSSYWTPYLSMDDPTFRKALYKINMYFIANLKMASLKYF